MKVWNRLAGVAPIVDHDPETVGQTQFLRNDSGGNEEMAENPFVGGRRLGETWYQLLGYNEEMHGSLRLDIVDHEALVVFVLDLRRDFAIGDALENGFHD